MHISATVSTAILAIAAFAIAAPSGRLAGPVEIEITGYSNSTKYYLAYETNFFGDLALKPDSDKANAIRFDIRQNGTLMSTDGMGLGVTPVWSDELMTGAVTFTNYTGTEGTYITPMKRNCTGKGEERHRSPHLFELVNSYSDFASWAVCESQYGPNIAYTTPIFNETAYMAGWPFPCYEVQFVVRRAH